jgi:hypothetical protein
MRRLTASRAPTAVAVVAAVVAVFAVMLPGFGQTTSSHGGTPTEVFMQTHPDTCLAVGPNDQTAMEQDFTLSDASHVLIYFTFEWGRLSSGEDGHIIPRLDGGGPFNGVEAWRFSGTTTTRTSGTIMWTFDNVAAGDHEVQVFARVSRGLSAPSADLNDCALTVFVIPVA